MPIETVDLTATVKAAAEKYGLNARQFLEVAQCEDPGLIPDQQSNVMRKDGTREPSFGIFQINIGHDAHPEITYEQATDPLWSAEWAAQEWAAGRAWQWTCYHLLPS